MRLLLTTVALFALAGPVAAQTKQQATDAATKASNERATSVTLRATAFGEKTASEEIDVQAARAYKNNVTDTAVWDAIYSGWNYRTSGTVWFDMGADDYTISGDVAFGSGDYYFNLTPPDYPSAAYSYDNAYYDYAAASACFSESADAYAETYSLALTAKNLMDALNVP